MPNRNDETKSFQDEYLALVERHEQLAARYQELAAMELAIEEDKALSREEKAERRNSVIADLEALSEQMGILVEEVRGLSAKLGNGNQ